MGLKENKPNKPGVPMNVDLAKVLCANAKGKKEDKINMEKMKKNK